MLTQWEILGLGLKTALPAAVLSFSFQFFFSARCGLWGRAEFVGTDNPISYPIHICKFMVVNNRHHSSHEK
jgi:hypothetical protein